MNCNRLRFLLILVLVAVLVESISGDLERDILLSANGEGKIRRINIRTYRYLDGNNEYSFAVRCKKGHVRDKSGNCRKEICSVEFYRERREARGKPAPKIFG